MDRLPVRPQLCATPSQTRQLRLWCRSDARGLSGARLPGSANRRSGAVASVGCSLLALASTSTSRRGCLPVRPFGRRHRQSGGRQRQHRKEYRCVVAVASADEAAVLPEASLAVAAALSLQSTDQSLTVLATLAAAIVCHEGGHYLCARSVGLKAREFALGFGPQVLTVGEDDRGTLFILRALPFGGYVSFDEAKTIEVEEGRLVNEFEAMAVPARLWVLAGGVLANVVAASTSLAAAALTAGVPRKQPLPGIRVENVGEEAATRTGLQTNDVLLRIGALDLNNSSSDVRTTVDFIHELPAKEPVKLLVERGSRLLELDVLPVTDPTTGLQRLGVMINNNTVQVMDKANSLPEAFGIAGDYISRLCSTQVIALQNILSGSGPGEVVGPVGILKQGEDMAASDGLLGLGIFFITVNLNLAILNALPIPALDGGKAAFVLLEQISGRRLEEGKKEDIELAFVLVVVASLLSVTAKDVFRLFQP